MMEEYRYNSFGCFIKNKQQCNDTEYQAKKKIKEDVESFGKESSFNKYELFCNAKLPLNEEVWKSVLEWIEKEKMSYVEDIKELDIGLGFIRNLIKLTII